MTIELQVLTWTVVLGIVHILAASSAASLQRGMRWNLSARDEPIPPLTGVAARLERALRNFLETFPLFAALVLAVQVNGVHSDMSEWGARLYLAARVIYLPLYAFGVPVMRSVVWGIALWGMTMLVGALLKY